jgi:hypothetical protein
MQPTLRNKPQWTIVRDEIAKIDLDKVIAGDPLILSAPEVVQIFAIQLAQSRCHVVAVIVFSVNDRLRRSDRGNCELHGGNIIPLVGKDLRARRMVDRHQGQ